MVSPNTKKLIKQNCNVLIENGIIPKSEFNELMKLADKSCLSAPHNTNKKQNYLTKADLRERYRLKSNKPIEAWVKSGKLKIVILTEGVQIPTKNGSRRAGGTVRFKKEDVEQFELEHFQS